MPCFDIFRNGVHRSGTIKSDCRNYVLKCSRLQLCQHLLHSRRFKLKYTVAFSRTYCIIRCTVVYIDLTYIKAWYAFPYLILRIFDYGKVSECKKVELQQSKLRYCVHIELSDNYAVIYGYGNIRRYLILGYDYSCRMSGSVSRHSLNSGGCVDKSLYLWIAVIHLLQLAVLHGNIKSYMKLLRYFFRYLVNLIV